MRPSDGSSFPTGWTDRVPATIVDIDRESLWGQMERCADFVLVDALGPISFAGAHLPGAINLPPHEVDDRAPSRIPNLDTEVVVYCASVDCDSSVAVAGRLLELGYRSVKHYPGGKRDWVEGGLPLEGGRV
jgi:rhodanese-related sulfurtransferase